MTIPTPVPEEMIYRDGGGMSLACGHKSDGFIRGSGNDPRYHCPVCRTAEESIFAIRARERYEQAGWGDIFDGLRERLQESPDLELRKLADDLADLVEGEEAAGWGHGHRDDQGWCSTSGHDCPDCERLDRIREWVESHCTAERRAREPEAVSPTEGMRPSVA